jgi:hypothetical protein
VTQLVFPLHEVVADPATAKPLHATAKVTDDPAAESTAEHLHAAGDPAIPVAGAAPTEISCLCVWV